MKRTTDRRLRVIGKVRLVSRIVGSFVLVHVLLRRAPLPEVVRRLGSSGSSRWGRIRPLRMSNIVHRTLGVGRWRPRCLIGALVLFRLLRDQGDPAELVIGLPTEPRDKDAHAWVELNGADIGPPPGKNGHDELARYA